MGHAALTWCLIPSATRAIWARVKPASESFRSAEAWREREGSVGQGGERRHTRPQPTRNKVLTANKYTYISTKTRIEVWGCQDCDVQKRGRFPGVGTLHHSGRLKFSNTCDYAAVCTQPRANVRRWVFSDSSLDSSTTEIWCDERVI